MMSLPSYSRIVAALATAVMGFILLPVAFIVLYAFNDTAYLALPPNRVDRLRIVMRAASKDAYDGHSG